jgi:diaminopimelate epimerase
MDINPQNLGIKLKYLEGGLSVNIGNPHVIFFVTELTKKKLEEDSKKIINGNLFPEGVNVSAVKVISRNEIKVMTFERGVGLTDACGSGASASVFASCKMNYCDTKVKVSMVGGDLDVEITKDEHILIVGDAMEVFEGNVNLEEFV